MNHQYKELCHPETSSNKDPEGLKKLIALKKDFHLWLNEILFKNTLFTQFFWFYFTQWFVTTSDKSEVSHSPWTYHNYKQNVIKILQNIRYDLLIFFSS